MYLACESWHEPECRRPDVVLMENLPTCMSCGSIYVHSGEDDLDRGDLSVTTPTTFDANSARTGLGLSWPSTIRFSTPADVEDDHIRAALRKFRGVVVPVSALNPEVLRDSKKGHAVRLDGNSESLEQHVPLGSPTYAAEGQQTLESTRRDKENLHVLNSLPMYRSLSGQDEIRLLHLSPSPSDDNQALHGALRLSRLSHRPVFTALSYTWADPATGDRSRRETIFLGSDWTPLPITANCAAALRRLRSQTNVRTVWVDAICIDQDNTGERSHQVGLMRDIYSRARRVVIFLGDDGGPETADGQLMARMGDDCFYKGNTARIEWELTRDYVALRALFERSYWRRSWVIQEVLLSKEALVMLGGSSVPLSHILRGHMLGWNNGELSQLFPSWIQLAGSSVDGDVDAFSELLLKTWQCQAADGRDKVFALLGLVQGAHLEGLVADYTKTSDEVYTGLAAYFLIRHGQSKILKWASLSSSSLSWVPAWHLGPVGKTMSQAPQPIDYAGTYKVSVGQPSFPSLEGAVGPRRDAKWTFEDTVTPDHPRRVSSSGPWRVPDVLDILRPRVFQETGSLLITAYPVLQLNPTILKKAFTLDWSVAGSRRLMMYPTRPEMGQQWEVILNPGDSVADLVEDWIVEVPNCDVFLHLKPHSLSPDMYKIHSICHLTLKTALTSWEGSKTQEARPPEDKTLILRLLLFQPDQLVFLQSWEKFMEANSSLKRSGVLGVCISATDITKYRQWMEDLGVAQLPGNEMGRTSETTISDADPALHTVLAYLDSWADLVLWDSISELVNSIQWHAYADALEVVRSNALLGVTAGCQPESGLFRSVSRADLVDHISHQLTDTLELLMDAVDGLNLPGLSGRNMCMGEFRLADTAGRLRKSIENIPSSWQAHEFRARKEEIFVDWTEFVSHLRYMHHLEHRPEWIKKKFIQHQVLRRLYARVDSREFLIC